MNDEQRKRLRELFLDLFEQKYIADQSTHLPAWERYKPYNKARDAIREYVREIVKTWMEENGLGDCGFRMEFRLYAEGLKWAGPQEPHINLGYCSIHSSTGSVSLNNKAMWLNKITVTTNGIIKHIARTDQRFVGMELPEKFRDYIKELTDEVSELLRQTKGE